MKLTYSISPAYVPFYSIFCAYVFFFKVCTRILRLRSFSFPHLHPSTHVPPIYSCTTTTLGGPQLDQRHLPRLHRCPVPILGESFGGGAGALRGAFGEEVLRQHLEQGDL